MFARCSEQKLVVITAKRESACSVSHLCHHVTRFIQLDHFLFYKMGLSKMNLSKRGTITEDRLWRRKNLFWPQARGIGKHDPRVY